jgi:hypothetical protein
MFVRFIIEDLDGDSGRRQGLFQAAKRLKESGLLSQVDADHLEQVYVWFKRKLKKPTRLSLSPWPNSKAQALSWFKHTATEHIAKMREYAEILERYGMRVQMIKAKRLGYVLYEDDFQVAAYPFSDTPT